ncbi:ABC transporter permease [Ruania alba]|uniref:ABC-2 type transport system permease protein n=1 Tax=Ruania alba TaxID=648782 RepID=A0A1H5H3E2_9MICO|nr:ABC transporter permease [Ruania alba]SEE22523.1 ABC-2 type transport system permease protein [Ruania alba]
MNGFMVAVAVEARKATASRVLCATTAILVLGLAALTVGLELGAQSGNPNVTAQLGPLATLEGWPRMLGLVAQITAAGALIAFGVALSWLVGREFTDGTITGLFGLPVTRPAIVLAKLAVYLAWVVGVALAVAVVVGVTGVAVGHGFPGAQAIAGLVRQLALTMLTGLVAVPAAWAATLGRGLLPGIAATIGLVICGQVMAVAGVGAWFPVAAPALWALAPDTVAVPQLVLVVVLAVAFAALTASSWSRLQLDR